MSSRNAVLNRLPNVICTTFVPDKLHLPIETQLHIFMWLWKKYVEGENIFTELYRYLGAQTYPYKHIDIPISTYIPIFTWLWKNIQGTPICVPQNRFYREQHSLDLLVKNVQIMTRLLSMVILTHPIRVTHLKFEFKIFPTAHSNIWNIEIHCLSTSNHSTLQKNAIWGYC